MSHCKKPDRLSVWMPLIVALATIVAERLIDLL